MLILIKYVDHVITYVLPVNGKMDTARHVRLNHVKCVLKIVFFWMQILKQIILYVQLSVNLKKLLKTDNVLLASLMKQLKGMSVLR